MPREYETVAIKFKGGACDGKTEETRLPKDRTNFRLTMEVENGVLEYYHEEEKGVFHFKGERLP